MDSDPAQIDLRAFRHSFYPELPEPKTSQCSLHRLRVWPGEENGLFKVIQQAKNENLIRVECSDLVNLVDMYGLPSYLSFLWPLVQVFHKLLKSLLHTTHACRHLGYRVSTARSDLAWRSAIPLFIPEGRLPPVLGHQPMILQVSLCPNSQPSPVLSP